MLSLALRFSSEEPWHFLQIPFFLITGMTNGEDSLKPTVLTEILAVNPAILSSTGMDAKAVLWATAIASGIFCIMMRLS